MLMVGDGRIPEFDEPPASVRRRMKTIEVDDPDPRARRVVVDKATGGLKLITPTVRVRANIARDVLSAEYAARRISEPAFRRGRLIEDTLRRGNPTGGGQWMEGDRVDAASAHEHAIATGVDAAAAAIALRYEIRVRVGERMATAVCLVLGDGLSLAEMAFAMSRDGARRQVHYYSRLFRDGLEDFTKAKDTARGAVQSQGYCR